MCHDKELTNSIRKFDLDAKICIVPLILNCGSNHVLIILICCPYLKKEDMSLGYFPQGPCPVAGGPAWSCSDPAYTRHRFGSTSDYNIFEGNGCWLKSLLGGGALGTDSSHVEWQTGLLAWEQSLMTLLGRCVQTVPCQSQRDFLQPWGLSKPQFDLLAASHLICWLTWSPMNDFVIG